MHKEVGAALHQGREPEKNIKLNLANYFMLLMMALSLLVLLIINFRR